MGLHLNFCFYLEYFQSTFAGVWNYEATVITRVSRWPQETVQISKNVYRSSNNDHSVWPNEFKK